MIKTPLLSFFALVLMTTTTPLLASAKTKTEKKPVSAMRVLKDVSKKYRVAKLVKIETEKKVTSELMGKTTNYKGIIYLSQGKFRWENSTPEESLLLFDGDVIWNVQYPPKDLGGSVQVARAKLNKNTKSQILISTLIGKESIEKNFDILNEKTEDGTLGVELKPRSNDLRVKQLMMYVDAKAKEILKISYKDDVDNLTVVELKKTEFIKKENKDLFKYQIPKDAQVTNL